MTTQKCSPVFIRGCSPSAFRKKLIEVFAETGKQYLLEAAEKQGEK